MATTMQDILRQQQQQQNQQQPAPSPLTSLMQGATQYNQVSGGGLSKLLGGGGGGAAAAAGGGSSAAGGAGFGLGQPLVTGGIGSASFAGGAGGGAAGAAGGAGGGGAMSGLMSNPWTAAAAAIIGGANYFDNKDISSWSDTLKGKAGSNILDYYGGREDGSTHGTLGKIFDKDRATGQLTKSITDLSELDFSNAWGNLTDGVKSIFKLRF